MSHSQTNLPLSFSISELKEQYQNHPSMFEVQLLILQLKQEKLKARTLYQSLKKCRLAG